MTVSDTAVFESIHVEIDQTILERLRVAGALSPTPQGGAYRRFKTHLQAIREILATRQQPVGDLQEIFRQYFSHEQAAKRLAIQSEELTRREELLAEAARRVDKIFEEDRQGRNYLTWGQVRKLFCSDGHSGRNSFTMEEEEPREFINYPSRFLAKPLAKAENVHAVEVQLRKFLLRRTHLDYGEKLPAAEIDGNSEAFAFLDYPPEFWDSDCGGTMGEFQVDNFPPVKPQTLRYWDNKWWRWESGNYNNIPDNEVRAAVVKFLAARWLKVTSSHINNVMDHLRSQSLLPSNGTAPPCWIGRPVRDWDLNEVYVTTTDIFHLPTIANGGSEYTIKTTPHFFCTNAVDVDYDPIYYGKHLGWDDEGEPIVDSKCENWLKFLQQLWPNDLQSISTLQEWFGYCLTRNTSQQKIMLLVGPTRSGKGTITKVLKSIVGESNVCGPTLHQLTTEFGLDPLLGKSVAIIGDARSSRMTDQAILAERLLTISGQDSLDVNRKHSKHVTAGAITTKLMILSNELPRFQDQSGALADRMLILKLTESFLGREDTNLQSKLVDEVGGIVHWAIEGWARLRKRDKFIQPATSLPSRDQLNELASPMKTFVYQRCQKGPDLACTVADMYDAWCRWCNRTGETQTTVAVFGRDLMSVVPNIEKKETKIGGRHYIYKGIALTVEGINSRTPELTLGLSD